mmetsp:Transcript_63081/g.135448  ORF Transcript_63081/g.135448 Transcript_63081/m.135448 type:complete len:224 (-) Transcript_63081:366-1037(-)
MPFRPAVGVSEEAEEWFRCCGSDLEAEHHGKILGGEHRVANIAASGCTQLAKASASQVDIGGPQVALAAKDRLPHARRRACWGAALCAIRRHRARSPFLYYFLLLLRRQGRRGQLWRFTRQHGWRQWSSPCRDLRRQWQPPQIHCRGHGNSSATPGRARSTAPRRHAPWRDAPRRGALALKEPARCGGPWRARAGACCRDGRRASWRARAGGRCRDERRRAFP